MTAPRGPSRKQEDKIISARCVHLFREGVDPWAIAERLGISRENVAIRLAKRGIKVRRGEEE